MPVPVRLAQDMRRRGRTGWIYPLPIWDCRPSASSHGWSTGDGFRSSPTST